LASLRIAIAAAKRPKSSAGDTDSSHGNKQTPERNRPAVKHDRNSSPPASGSERDWGDATEEQIAIGTGRSRESIEYTHLPACASVVLSQTPPGS
jgi:hypothetical protein